jgi:hypothetical protein
MGEAGSADEGGAGGLHEQATAQATAPTGQASLSRRVDIAAELQERVLGQPEAVEAATRCLQVRTLTADAAICRSSALPVYGTWYVWCHWIVQHTHTDGRFV